MRTKAKHIRVNFRPKHHGSFLGYSILLNEENVLDIENFQLKVNSNIVNEI